VIVTVAPAAAAAASTPSFNDTKKSLSKLEIANPIVAPSVVSPPWAAVVVDAVVVVVVSSLLLQAPAMSANTISNMTARNPSLNLPLNTFFFSLVNRSSVSLL
jgi:hypothetical protein